MLTVGTLDGRVVLVTGAAGGIGTALARSLVAAGAGVALADVDEAGLRRSVDQAGGGHAEPFLVDLASDDETAALPARVVEHFGRLDVLVNNAGIRKITPMADLGPEEWRRTLDINLTAPYVLSRAAIPAMLGNGRGKIVNIASLAGLTAVRGRAAYGAAKAGMIMLTRTIALEFGHQGIWCNALAPGVIETPMTSHVLRSPEMTGTVRAITPVGRAGQPDEVAQSVIFLAGPDSDYINGVTIPIDGGWSTGYHGLEI